MAREYFNFETYLATGRGERRRALRAWWRLSVLDPGWSPPHYGLLRDALEAEALQRQTIALLWIEAMSRPAGSRRRQDMSALAFHQAGLNQQTLPHPVATARLLRSPTAPSRAYVTLFACINDKRVLDALLESLSELAREAGCRELHAPLGPLPFLPAGAQESHWHRPAPADAPQTPPFTSELLARRMGPLRLSSGAPAGPLTMYRLPVDPAPAEGPATVAPLTAEMLLPLLPAALPEGLPPPDPGLLPLLRRWLAQGRMKGWLAQMDGEPAGFLLLRQDARQRMRLLRGGRRLPGRIILSRFPGIDPIGYVPLAAVLPAWRERGIGRQLWHHACRQAAADGQQTILVGPVGREQRAAAALLRRRGTPEATYNRFLLSL